MQTQNVRKEKGLSLKTTSIVMMIASIIITIVLLITSIRSFQSFRNMEKSTDNYILLEEAADELMRASDYLTEEVQCYTVLGERKHLENYFTEANVTRRREHAIFTMEAAMPESAALAKLEKSMAESLSLMDREYYAMRLMLEAAGDTEIPEAIKDIQLTEEHEKLTAGEKVLLAQRMVHDTAYYEQKNRIRVNMTECLEELKADTQGTQQGMEDNARRDMTRMIVLIFIQSAVMFLMIILQTRLGIRPVLSAVNHIKMDQELPIVGASEFRYLAGTYNVMYAAYKKSIANLSFKASHDDLTGVYNRAGYDLIKDSLDMGSTALLLFDADEFKSINDQYGHETGDQVLKKIAAVLKKNFRSDDYVCRIGGDEFVVFMVHTVNEPRQLITNKVIRINQELAGTEDGLPGVSVSAGVSFSPVGGEPAELFRQADVALYYVKDHGREGCCFYSEKMKGKAKPNTDR